MKIITIQYTLTITILFSLFSCGKYLDAIPDKQLAIPENLSDLQALLDNYYTMNAYSSPLPEVLGDNIFVNQSDWASVSNATIRNLYTWQADENTISEWSVYMNQINNSNVVLDAIDQLTNTSNKQESEQIEGEALFFRAFYHFQIATLFALPYDPITAVNDLGIPLRLTSDFNIPSHRSSIKESYEAIMADLKKAASLLRQTTSLKTRPNRAAAYGMLARVSQTMQQYEAAGSFARLCLDLYTGGELMNFNTLDSSSNAPIVQFNQEVIFHCVSSSHPYLSNSRLKINIMLYDSYKAGDLRKAIYYYQTDDGYTHFKGDYNGAGISNVNAFPGITLDEQYFILAESQARANNADAAVETLNQLLITRWKTGEFTPILTLTASEALDLVLAERRKELVMRGTRWLDIRRLMKEEGKVIIPKRVLGEQVYELLPGSVRYALKFPATVIQNSNMPQNP